MGSYILRSTTEYANKDGREISLRKREELFADPAYRTLRIREPGSREGALVYTFWCGILPLVYETEIVTARVIVSRRRYATEAEAIAGHDEVVRTGTTALGQACCKHGALPGENCVVCLPAQRPTLVHKLQYNQGMYAMAKPVSSVRVSDVMTRNVVCVEQSLSVEALTSLFLERGFSAAPVVDDNGKPVGVVSKTDLLREVQDRADTEEHVPDRRVGRQEERVELGLGFQITRIARATVGEIMTPIPLTLSEDAPLSEAAALITLGGVHHLPVVRQDGKVVGILSALDVVCWLAEHNPQALSAITRI
jgi:CBS domain-containing protein